MTYAVRRLLSIIICAALLFDSCPAFAADKPTPEPTEAVPYYLVGSTLVYIADSGIRYHSTNSCYPIEKPHLLSLEEACRLGYTPCEKNGCYPPASVPADPNFAFPDGAVIVYLGVGDDCYHRAPGCGGMENAVAVTLEEARYLDKQPCTKCDPPQ
jgi:hypothetical protein